MREDSSEPIASSRAAFSIRISDCKPCSARVARETSAARADEFCDDSSCLESLCCGWRKGIGTAFAGYGNESASPTCINIFSIIQSVKFMTTAFLKIHSFINSLKDDEVIRATDQKLSDAELKKDKNAKFDNNKGATHLYVRSGLLSKLRQALTISTDGAIQKQHLAKELIFKTLDNLPDDLKNNDSVKKSIKNITDILKNNELKDFTAGMIRNDLDVINNAFQFHV
jgi:hypothetical protein